MSTGAWVSYPERSEGGMPPTMDISARVEHRLVARNELFHSFFAREAPRLAAACHEMSERFLRGGRLLAFGRGPYATDAQHVSVVMGLLLTDAGRNP